MTSRHHVCAVKPLLAMLLAFLMVSLPANAQPGDSTDVPDLITGTSMGAIIGGLYAAGYDTEALEEVAATLDWDRVFSNVAERRHQAAGAFYQKLIDRGKPALVAIVAVMRKLLHSIYGMLKHDTDFDGEKFYQPPPETP